MKVGSRMACRRIPLTKHWVTRGGRSGRCSNRCAQTQEPERSFNRRSSNECVTRLPATHETSRECSLCPGIMRCLSITFSVVVRVSFDFLSNHTLGHFSPNAVINTEWFSSHKDQDGWSGIRFQGCSFAHPLMGVCKSDGVSLLTFVDGAVKTSRIFCARALGRYGF
jgi:hypothetical protein